MLNNDKKNICPVCGADVNLDYKPVKSLFGLWKEDDEPVKLNTSTRVLTGRLIKKFGYEAVREAFIQAGITKERQTLYYVRGILMKKSQQFSVKKSRDEALRMKRETENINPEFFIEAENIDETEHSSKTD